MKKIKKFLKFTLEWKIAASLIFTATLFCYLIFCLFLGKSQAPTLLLWGVLGMSAAGALLQTLCFSDWVFKKLRYTRRSLLFVLLFLPVLALIAWKTRWFPAGYPGAWLGFLGIFFLIFAAMTVGFECYFRITGRKYDGLIGQYRKSVEANRPDSADGHTRIR